MKLTEAERDKLERKLNKFRIKKHYKQCWGWNGAVAQSGNPRVSFRGISTGANRCAYLVRWGELQRFHFVTQVCKNKLCTNPYHLIATTERSSKKDPSMRKNPRFGRERLNLDLPEKLVKDVKAAAMKHNQTVTKYVCKRLIEAINYEKKVDGTTES